MKYWYMLQHEQTLKTCSLKEVSHKGPQMIRFCFYEMSRIGKFIETESRLVVVGSWMWEEWEVTANWVQDCFRGDNNVLELDSAW